MFPSLEIFGKVIGTYSLSAIIGLAVCAAVATALGKKYNIRFEDIILFLISIGVGLVLGGHILYGIVNIPMLIKVLSALPERGFSATLVSLSTVFGGSVFYGGLFGSIIAMKIHLKFSKLENKHVMMNIYATVIPLFHVFGRIGCFFGGCCYGIESDFGFTVHNNEYVPSINGVSRFPVSLLEATLNLIIFFVVLYMFKKFREKYSLIHLYLFLYSMVRFSTEFLRGDEYRGIWGPFSTSQWISLALFVYTVTRFIIKKARQKKLN